MKQFLISIFCLLLSAGLTAQIFSAGLAAGGNFSQIDGDLVAGYSKLGLNAGVFSQVAINNNMSAQIEILYSQKGSSSVLFNADQYVNDFRYLLDYIEIPILFNYHESKFLFSGGLSVNRLVRSAYFTQGVEDVNYFNAEPAADIDLCMMAGVTYMFNSRLGAQLRGSYSLTPIRSDIDSRYRNGNQYHNVAALRLIYLFKAQNQLGEDL